MSMREMIQDVLATELEARRIVQAANAEAERLLLNAQKQGQELNARLRQQAQEGAKALLKTALEAAEEQKRQQLAGVTCQIEREVRLDEGTRRAAVDELVRTVCGTD